MGESLPGKQLVRENHLPKHKICLTLRTGQWFSQAMYERNIDSAKNVLHWPYNSIKYSFLHFYASVSHPLHSTGAATLHKQTRVAKFTRLHLAYNNCCNITSQAKISHLLDYCYSAKGEILTICTDKAKLITFGHALKYSLFIMSLMFGFFLVGNLRVFCNYSSSSPV